MLTRLCEWVLFFNQQRFNPASFSDWIFTATGLLVRGLFLGAHRPQCMSTMSLLRGSWWWTYLPLRRKIPSPTPHGMKKLLENFSTTSTVGF
jgi:hypothetical protein